MAVDVLPRTAGSTSVKTRKQPTSEGLISVDTQEIHTNKFFKLIVLYFSQVIYTKSNSTRDEWNVSAVHIKEEPGLKLHKCSTNVTLQSLKPVF